MEELAPAPLPGAVQLRRPEAHRHRPQLFATPADEQRARRASDLIEVVVGLFLLAGVSLAAAPDPGIVRALGEFFAALPDFLDGAWAIFSDGLALLAVLVVVTTLVRRRWAIARDLLLAIFASVGLALLVSRSVEGSWPAAWESFRAAGPPAWYPPLRLALAAAVLLTATPYLTLPARRLCHWVLGLGALGLTALGATSILGVAAGLLVGMIAAAGVHLAVGSSAGRPSAETIHGALAELGVATTSLGAAARQLAGVYIVHATNAEGDELVVKIYGRDAHDTALTSTLWRRVWYREAGSPLRLGRLLQVEHEAFLTLFARQAGVLTDEVVTAGETASDDAILVVRRHGLLLGEAEAAGGLDGDDIADQVWTVLGRLHAVGVAHGQIDDDHLLVRDGELGLVNFRGAAAGASDLQRRTDQVQALVTAALLAGPERAVRGALAALGADELTATLPYVQAATLTPRQRDALAEERLDLSELRTAAAAAVGREPPELIELRRITFGSLIRVVLPAIAVMALMSGLAGLDFAELADQVRDATWWLVALGVIIAQLPRLTQAVSTLGASPVPLPLGPVYALQLAVSYVNLAIPSAAGRIAVNIRFFQRHGVPAGSAVAAGAIDGFGGFVAQATLLLILLLFTSVSLDLDVGEATSGAVDFLVIVLVIAGIALVLLAVIKRWREWVLGWLKRLSAEAWGAVRGLRSPRRIALLFGGNFATELLFALALAAFAHALGFPLDLGTALLINISIALLSGLLPIPGGIGVAEGGLTWGLVQAGMPEGAAFAAVLLYRLSTFYLPPIWGFFAMRWLERHDHL